MWSNRNEQYPNGAGARNIKTASDMEYKNCELDVDIQKLCQTWNIRTEWNVEISELCWM